VPYRGTILKNWSYNCSVVIKKLCSTNRQLTFDYSKILESRNVRATCVCPIMWNVTSSTKPEVHNVLYCCQRNTEPRRHITYTENLVKFGHAAFEICERTDDLDHQYKPTDRVKTKYHTNVKDHLVQPTNTYTHTPDRGHYLTH